MANRPSRRLHDFSPILTPLLSKTLHFILACWILASNSLSVKAQNYYEIEPSYEGRQAGIYQPFGVISNFSNEFSNLPLTADLPAPFEYAPFPYYPQTVEGYSPSLQFQNNVQITPQSTQLNIPEAFNNSSFAEGDSQYRILGEVTSGIPIGNSQYDSIPVLEDFGL